jgi:DNA-binding LacI/PurR family transcriptional regulator
MRELDKTSMSEWASVKLTTIGESCRAMLRESIRTMIDWVLDRIETYGGSLRDRTHVYARLRLI